jgi:predicted transcriptional regulator
MEGRMSTTMSIHKLRTKAKVDRGQACLKYMETRTTPVTLKELASKLGVTTKAVSNSLMPLLEEGKVQRELMLRQSSICKKLGWAYGYYATERKDKVKKAKAPKFQFHNPFNIGVGQ